MGNRAEKAPALHKGRRRFEAQAGYAVKKPGRHAEQGAPHLLEPKSGGVRTICYLEHDKPHCCGRNGS